MNSINNYLSIKEAANFIGVCKGTLRNWEREGKIKSHRNPKNQYRLYVKSELEDFLKSISGNQTFLYEKTKEEEREDGYRQGYHHGYLAALRDPTRAEDVKKWRYEEDLSIMKGAPASHFEGVVLNKKSCVSQNRHKAGCVY